MKERHKLHLPLALLAATPKWALPSPAPEPLDLRRLVAAMVD